MALDAASIAEAALRGLQADSPVYFGLGQVVRNVSAVTGQCMMLRRSVFEESGGFDRRLGSPAAEIDLCLRLRRAGFLVVCTPHSRVRVGASGPPALTPRERRVLGRRFRAALARGDPYFHPNLLPDFSEVRFRL